MSGDRFFAIFGKLAVVLILVGIIAGGAYYLGAKNQPQKETQTKNTVKTTVTPTITPQVTTAANITPEPTVDETAALSLAIKNALVTEHGSVANDLNITVSKIKGDYASGAASQQGGGGIWYAAKVNGVWKLVWDGNGFISCSNLTNYPNFPTSMIPQCYNDQAKAIVNR